MRQIGSLDAKEGKKGETYELEDLNCSFSFEEARSTSRRKSGIAHVDGSRSDV